MTAERVTVTINAEWTAAFDTLLAVEGFADHVYSDRASNPESQARYNALAEIVLPIRAAIDAANEAGA